MQGRQLKFYLHPADIPEIGSDLQARFDVAFVAGRSPSCELTKLFNLAVPEAPWSWLAYACRRPDLEKIEPTYVPGVDGYWTLNVDSDPVIEVSLSRLRDRTLHPGRLYYTPKCIDADGHSSDKDGDFLALAKEVFSFLRKGLAVREFPWGKERLGKAATALEEAGEIELSMN